jgi:hypothetical protein
MNVRKVWKVRRNAMNERTGRQDGEKYKGTERKEGEGKEVDEKMMVKTLKKENMIRKY